MKTKLLFIALAFGLMSGTCSNDDDPIVTDDCNCTKTYYTRTQTGWSGASPVYTFVPSGSESPVAIDCALDTDEYVLENGEWYKINCE